MDGCLGKRDDKLFHWLVLQLDLHNGHSKLPFTMSNSLTIRTMKMSLGHRRCGLHTDMSQDMV